MSVQGDNNYEAIQKIFLSALDLKSPEEREAYLDEACGEDLSLRESLDALLKEYEEGGESSSGANPASRDATAATFVPGRVLADRYRIVSLLGRGGMGEVYRADDLKLEQAVALKFLPETLATNQSLLKALYNEVRQARRVAHRHVCRVYDIGEAEGLHFLSMEYIEGEDLGSLLRRIGRLPGGKLIELTRQLCAGLQSAHEEGILHLDLKPANLMIDQRGDLRVTDFGLARLASEAEEDKRCVGTPAYMAPEQLLEGKASPRSDIYAVGLVLYEMARGKRLCPARTTEEIRAFHQEGGPEAVLPREVGAIDPTLGDLIRRCVANDPEERPASLGEILKVLERFAAPGSEFPEVGGVPIKLEVLAPEKVRDSDVLITYEPVDDEAAMPGQQGWITQLHRNLQLRVAQLSGRNVAVVKQGNPMEQDAADPGLLEEVPRAKTVISILSPPFVQSTGCREVVETFWKRTEEAGNFNVHDRARLFNVVKTPVENEEIPLELQTLYSGLIPYEFFDRDADSGRLRVFDEAFGETAIRRFHEQVYDVAYDVAQILKYIGETLEPGLPRTAGSKTIFLAMTTSDLDSQRDLLRRELTELGHRVLPKQSLPLVAGELASAVESCLEQSDLAIHPVGAHFGLVPEATDLSVVALQNQIAARFSETSGLQRLIWVPRNLAPQDERQAAFLEQLETEPKSLAGAELIADTLENLKMLLRSRWRLEPDDELPSEDGSEASGAPRVYIICDQRDELAIEPIEDFFYENGIEVCLPGFDAEESEVQHVHIQNLRDCDAALIYYGAAGMHWVDFNTRDLQKAAGYRDSRPIPVSAVCLAPPFNRRKERFKSVGVDVVRQSGETFDPSILTGFVASMKEMSEEGP